MSTIKVTNLKHESSASDNISLDSSGRVGIGTSSPGVLFQVKNDTTTAYSAGSNPSSTTTVENLDTTTAYTPAISTWNARGLTTTTSVWYAGNAGLNNAYAQSAFVIGNRTGASSYAERLRIDGSGNLQFNSGYGSVATAYGCRAWVNFNGTGTVAIRASGNVSSITDNGTGAYTVNFTTAMVDANYAHEAQGSITLTEGNLNQEAKTHTAATGSVKVRASNNAVNNTAGDQAEIRVIIFR